MGLFDRFRRAGRRGRPARSASPAPPAFRPAALVVGLGNPGPDYDGTRHNVGFEAADALADALGAAFDREHDRALVAHAWDGGRALAIAKPLTFMNRSGDAVAPLLARYGLAPSDLLVVYDDLALPLGALRLRRKGGAGGHNGMRSIGAALGAAGRPSTEYPRLRIGVGDSFLPGRQVDYVLAPFDPDERGTADAAVARAADAARAVARDGLVAAMNQYNG